MKNLSKLVFTIIAIVIVCELIGAKSITLGPGKLVLLPMLYAVIIGILVTPKI